MSAANHKALLEAWVALFPDKRKVIYTYLERDKRNDSEDLQGTISLETEAGTFELSLSVEDKSDTEHLEQTLYRLIYAYLSLTISSEST